MQQLTMDMKAAQDARKSELVGTYIVLWRLRTSVEDAYVDRFYRLLTADVVEEEIVVEVLDVTITPTDKNEVRTEGLLTREVGGEQREFTLTRDGFPNTDSNPFYYWSTCAGEDQTLLADAVQAFTQGYTPIVRPGGRPAVPEGYERCMVHKRSLVSVGARVRAVPCRECREAAQAQHKAPEPTKRGALPREVREILDDTEVPEGFFNRGG